MAQAVHTIGGLNRLPPDQRFTYARMLIPSKLFAKYKINPDSFTDDSGQPLLQWQGSPGKTSLELSLFHQFGARDPMMYFHLADTINQQIHVLLTVINDPESPRFDVDRMPDGSKTHFGILKRNIEAEVAAMQAGLAPGQIRRGMRILRTAMECFEQFVRALGHDMYFVEPMSYHNAVIFERYGFAYQQGRRWMQSINTRFSPDGDLPIKLDGSTPFRPPGAQHSIRGRSWAVHDGIMGESYTGVTMYKRLGRHAGVTTFPDAQW